MKPIRVLLADEHVLMREGLRLILERSAGLSPVVAQYLMTDYQRR